MRRPSRSTSPKWVKRVAEGRDPGLPIETPALHAIFRHKEQIKTTYDVTDRGIVVVQTSTHAAAVKALQDHAAEVTDLAQRGWSRRTRP